MSADRELEKLRVLLTHWARHNEEHAREFEEWAARAEKIGAAEVLPPLRAAVEGMRKVNDHLEAALKRLGEPTGS
jgi:hypothetical protein